MNNDEYKINIDELIKKLNSNETGLTINQINSNKKHGINIIPKKKKKSIISLFFKEFKDPIVLVLLCSSILSFIIGEIVDALAILLIILLDAILGCVEEYKTNKAAESLQNLIKFETKVLRDNKEIIIDSSELVVGDIVLLESGDKVPADIRIIDSFNLTVDESILTGESIKVEKNKKDIKETCKIFERKNMVYASTNILTGRLKGIVTNIGVNTEVGKIANEVNNAKEEKTPLTIRTEKFSKQICVIIVIVSIVIAFFLKNKGYTNSEIFLSVIALAVSAMPEGLPLAFTMALTIGSNKMLKKNVIVKKLDAVESLGSCTVIASDKTGTLTVNEQTAKLILLPDDNLYEISGTGYNDEGNISNAKDKELNNIRLLLESTNINNEASLKQEKGKWIKTGDSIDIAFLSLGKKSKINMSSLVKIDEIPYESENKYSMCIFEKEQEQYVTIKGSVEVVLEHCNKMITNGKSKKIDKEKILIQNEELSKQGYRVIAVGTKKIDNKCDMSKEKNIEFLGLIAFIDPIRKSVPSAIKKCKKAGIKVVMITGDHPLTAFSIAKELKIVDYFNDIATSSDIDKYLNKSEIEFDNFIRNKTVFARITPIQKLKIVESFKRQGEFVAVTGDGVNDAPAIKSANIGIAMGSGTDVAKECASMIIKNDDFSSIIEGIEEGRVAYSNIRKISYFLLSCGLSEILFFILSIVFNYPMPLIAIQLLWINLVTDGLQDLAISFEKKEKNIMSEPPRKTKDSLFDKDMIIEILLSGIFIGIIVFLTWKTLIDSGKIEIKTARSIILMLMVMIQNTHVLNCRSEKQSTFKISFRSNWFIAFSIFGAIMLQIFFVRIPFLSNLLQINSITPLNVIIMIIMALPVLLIMELYKIIKFGNVAEK